MAKPVAIGDDQLFHARHGASKQHLFPATAAPPHGSILPVSALTQARDFLAGRGSSHPRYPSNKLWLHGQSGDPFLLRDAIPSHRQPSNQKLALHVQPGCKGSQRVALHRRCDFKSRFTPRYTQVGNVLPHTVCVGIQMQALTCITFHNCNPQLCSQRTCTCLNTRVYIQMGCYQRQPLRYLPPNVPV